MVTCKRVFVPRRDLVEAVSAEPSGYQARRGSDIVLTERWVAGKQAVPMSCADKAVHGNLQPEQTLTETGIHRLATQGPGLPA